MRVAIPLFRLGALKSLGPIIDESLHRGHETCVMLRGAADKVGEGISGDELLRIWPDVKTQQVDDINTPGLFAGMDAIIGLDLVEPKEISPSVHEALSAGTPILSVSHLYETAGRRPELRKQLTKIFYTSDFQRSLQRALYPDYFDGEAPAVNEFISGSVCTSQAPLCDNDADRRRWGLDPGQPIVLLMSLKLAVPDPFRRFVWGSGSRLRRTMSAVARGALQEGIDVWRVGHYHDICQALRDFCDREGAALVVKSREKNQDPPWLRDIADVYVARDEVEYPYTALRLMSLADLCVHFESGSVFEATHLGVPSMSIRIPQPHLYREYFEYSIRLRSQERGSIFNTPGVSVSVPHHDFARYLDVTALTDLAVDFSVRQQYAEKYLGFDDFLATHRVLDALEA